MRKLIIMFALTLLFSQNAEGTLSPVVTYWKTLTQEEKEIFLFSYLTQVYETHSELKSSVGYGEITEWYYDKKSTCLFWIQRSTS